MHHNRQTGNNRRINTAYGCFLFCGLVVLSISSVSLVPMDSGTAGSIGMLFILPATIAALIAMLAGCVLSIGLRNRKQLPVLAALSMIYLLLVIYEPFSADILNIINWLYGATATALPLFWFLLTRKQLQ